MSVITVVSLAGLSVYLYFRCKKLKKDFLLMKVAPSDQTPVDDIEFQS